MLALVLMLLLAIALAITIGWYAKDRADTARRLLDHTARRTEQIVILLDRTAPAERQALARVISGPTLGVRIRPGHHPVRTMTTSFTATCNVASAASSIATCLPCAVARW